MIRRRRADCSWKMLRPDRSVRNTQLVEAPDGTLTNSICALECHVRRLGPEQTRRCSPSDRMVPVRMASKHPPFTNKPCNCSGVIPTTNSRSSIVRVSSLRAAREFRKYSDLTSILWSWDLFLDHPEFELELLRRVIFRPKAPAITLTSKQLCPAVHGRPSDNPPSARTESGSEKKSGRDAAQAF